MGPSFNSVLTSEKETLGDLFMFKESEKGLKDDSDIFIRENYNFPQNPFVLHKSDTLLIPV